MDIQVESRGDRKVVRIKGKITVEHCAAMQSELDRVLEPGIVEVVVDFREVPFIDSSGVGEILRLFRLVREGQGVVTLINPNKKLRTVFALYRFEKFIQIRDNVAMGQE